MHSIPELTTFVEHIVLLKLSRALSAEEVTTVKSLAGAVEGVQSISCGANYTHRGQGFNYAVVVRFDSAEAEVEYQSHPEHTRIRDTAIKDLTLSSADAVFGESSRHI